MTFLELCQTVRQEVGISGTGPTTVLNQEGQLKVIVDFVAAADSEIQTLWADWNFLWGQYSSTTSSGNRAPATQKPTDLGAWDESSFFLDYTTDDNLALSLLKYTSYRSVQRNGVAVNNQPTHVVVQPDQNIILDPQPDATYTVTADYWKVPTKMTANADVSAIPIQFHRIIVARAKTMWAEREEAPEILLASAAEYADLLDKLEAHSLPNQSGRRMASVTEDITVTSE